MPLFQWTIEGRCNTTDEELQETIKQVFIKHAARICASVTLVAPLGNVQVAVFGHDFFHPAEEISAAAKIVGPKAADDDEDEGVSQELLDAVRALSEGTEGETK